MTPEEERLLLEERDFLRREVANLSEQVRLVVRAEHALTRSRRLVDRQLHRIRRLAAFALNTAASEAVPEILEHARGTLLDFFELDAAVALRCETSDPGLFGDLCADGPHVVASNAPAAARLLRFLGEQGLGPGLGAAPRVVVWVPLRSRTNEMALLAAWSTRANAHHRDLPRAEHQPFLELFCAHVTRALDNAGLTAELRQKNHELSASLEHLERAQAQLIQAQKLEAIGRLAGGIAHDFNNLLTLIMAAADSLRLTAGGAGDGSEDLDMIFDATKRGTAITRRLLAFGRQQDRREEAIDLNALTIDLSRMLKRLIDEDVTLRLDLDSRIPPVSADPIQVEQILMNLVLNARDAMPNGGTLTLETREVSKSERPE
ncbi:MAG TPA: hypothetical protein VGQ57_14535, partial [Polyangiaceae bacterium]|nr:hypothetical protein [Polyangiaceae bacterium]